MSIASEITRLQTAKANLKTSLEAKGATIASDATIDTYPTVLDDIPVCILQDKEVNVSSGTTLIEPDQGYTGLHSVSVTAEGGTSGDVVFFYDYDGTLVESYTGAEIQALSALPNAPDHSQDEVPLTFDEWNWTLAQIKAYNTSYPTADINVGAVYHTTDGKAHFYWNITTDNDGNGVEIALASSSGTVDWGDGSAIETITSNTISHVYASVGLFHCIVDNNGSYFTVSGGSSTRSSKREKLVKCFFPNTVTSIGDSAFYDCYSLKLITIPSSVTSIETYAFQYCYILQSVTIPSSVTSIGSSVFYGCYSLQSIKISSSVTSIGSSAFYYCYSLQSITIPNTVTSIGSGAFSGCYSLQSIMIPSGVTSIGTYAFQDCFTIQSVTIPSSVTSIGNYVFSGCYSLQSIIIPSGVTSIGDHAFSACYSIQSMTIPSGVTSIIKYAFTNCYSLQSITIPGSVTSIGNNAFSGCYSCYAVTILAATPPTLGTTVFNTTNQKKIYVPYSADHSILAAYQSATNWSDYASIMEELPE